MIDRLRESLKKDAAGCGCSTCEQAEYHLDLLDQIEMDFLRLQADYEYQLEINNGEARLQ